MATSIRTWATAFVGLLLLQAVWLLVVPPFQGVDEHDHVFKAAAVARGDWSGTHQPVELGWTELVAVPRDIAAAALPACEALEYTQRDDCHPSAELADGRVLIGSSAARYNPAFYAVTGTAALPFDGIAAVRAMRLAGAAWCAALIALAIVVVRRTARTPWPATALIATLTPTLLYSTAIVAPNGPEICAGLLLWCVLVFGAAGPGPAPRWVIVAGTVAAVHLAVLRSLGPLWLVLVLATAALAMGVPTFLRAARSRRLLLPIAVGGLAVVLGAAWTVLAGTNSPASATGPTFPGSPWPQMASNWLAWLFQQISAVPTRGDAGPAAVYVLFALIWCLLLLAALRVSHRPARAAVGAIFALTTAMAVAITALSYTSLGYAWQGRYSLPYVVGWFVLAGWVLDRSPRTTPGARPAPLAVGLAAAVGIALTALHVRDLFLAQSPYAGHGWWAASPVLICVLAAAGFGVLLLALRRRTPEPSPTEPTIRLRTPASAS